jgi:hypothetical protein
MEIDQQIINISNKLEDNYGNEYSEQFNYAIKDIKEKNNIQTIHIMVDLLDLTMDDDHKQKQNHNSSSIDNNIDSHQKLSI